MFYTTKQGNSNQEWLATVAVCPCCKSQKPKAEFKVVDGEEMCAKCQQEEVFA